MVCFVQMERLSSYLRVIIHNVNPEFASSDSLNECTRTKKVLTPYMRLALGRWPFLQLNCFFVWMPILKSLSFPLEDSNLAKEKIMGQTWKKQTP